jgi:hypothetical protein
MASRIAVRARLTACASTWAKIGSVWGPALAELVLLGVRLELLDQVLVGDLGKRAVALSRLDLAS